MNATATHLENDGRNWFTVQFDDGDTGIFGMTADGAMLDVDGVTVDDYGNAKNAAARRAIKAAN